MRRAVLFVPNETLRAFMTSVLELHGYEVHAFPDPRLCPLGDMSTCPCQSSQRVCCDVIVSDLDLYSHNGLTWYEVLGRRGCQVQHRAILSGRTFDPYETHRAIHNLGLKVFMKPMFLKEFIDWIEAISPGFDRPEHLVDWPPGGHPDA